MSEEQSNSQNRKARRAAAKSSGKPIASPTTAPKIKLAHADYSKPKDKTLLDLYNDKKDLLQQGQPFDPKHTDGAVRDEEGNVLQPIHDQDLASGPVSDAFFWAVPLSMFHFTLDVLTHNQYRQEISWPEIWQHAATVLPTLWLAIYLTRTRIVKRWRVLRQIAFLIVSVSVGCYTIMAGNKFSYYAVMKQAPPLGTIWVWSVIELDLPYALASLLAVLLFLWYSGFSVF